MVDRDAWNMMRARRVNMDCWHKCLMSCGADSFCLITPRQQLNFLGWQSVLFIEGRYAIVVKSLTFPNHQLLGLHKPVHWQIVSNDISRLFQLSTGRVYLTPRRRTERSLWSGKVASRSQRRRQDSGQREMVDRRTWNMMRTDSRGW